MAASFQVPEDGFDHAFPMPDVPPPEDLPTLRERFERAGVPLTPWLAGRGRSTSATSTRRAGEHAEELRRCRTRTTTCGCGPTAGCRTTRSSTRWC